MVLLVRQFRNALFRGTETLLVVTKSSSCYLMLPTPYDDDGHHPVAKIPFLQQKETHAVGEVRVKLGLT